MDPRRRKSMLDGLGSEERMRQTFDRRSSESGLMTLLNSQVDMYRPDNRQQLSSQAQQCLGAVMRSASHQMPACELARRVPGSPESLPDLTGNRTLYAAQLSIPTQNWTRNYTGNEFSPSQTVVFPDGDRNFAIRPEQNTAEQFFQTPQMANWCSSNSSCNAGIPVYGQQHSTFSPSPQQHLSDLKVNVSIVSHFPSQNPLAGYSAAQATDGWMSKHPCAWSPSDCQFWFRSVAQENKIPLDQVNLFEFRGMNGASLMRLGNMDFILKDKDHGYLWYSALQQILCKASAENTFIPKIEPVDSGVFYQDSLPFLSSANSAGTDISEYLHWDFTKDEFDDIDVEPGTTFPLSLPHEYPATGPANGQYHPIQFFTENYSSSFGNASVNSDGIDCRSDLDSDRSSNISTYSNSDMASGRGCSFSSNFSQDGRSPSSADSTPPRQVRTRTGAKPEKSKGRSKHGTRGNHLWEFIRDLLKDRNSQPKIVKWENREDGVFRFVESETVAKLWGDKKCNPRMTYEKLSRAMRTYYGNKILLPVPKTGRYPKKLVYQFGPNAKDWK